MLLHPLLLISLLGCSSPHPQSVTVFVDPDDEALSAITTLVNLVGDDRLNISVDSASIAEAENADGLAIVVEPSGECAECYVLRDEDGAYQVEAGGLLGKQYGVAHMLELFGYRFPHPFRARLPTVLPRGLSDDHPDLLVLNQPEQTLRGLHLHTLHPIEGLWGFWADPPQVTGTDPLLEGPARVEAIADWVVKNRGNHLQWVALDDVESFEGFEDDDDLAEAQAAWLEGMTATVETVQARGLSAGVGVQLFGSGNLQNAFDLLEAPDDWERPKKQKNQSQEQYERALVDARDTAWSAAMTRRWALLTGAGFDVYDLSFGEFFGEDPDVFLDAVELARETLSTADAQAEMSAVVHVGDDQRVDYDGEEIIYYTLVQYADADITPHVHTVMFYNLYDDAGGAYHHDDFAEHRALLHERLQAGQPVGYFPESAYWIAFDNPVPQYLPLYLKSRHHDLASIRADAQAGGYDDLSEHVLFSSGWEWGYWQNDALTLRMGWELPDDWGDLLREWYAVDGIDGVRLADEIVALAELQQVAHIEHRLAAYLAGRDGAMDAGFIGGIVAAPDRIELSELAALSDSDQATFETDLITPLADYELELNQMLIRVNDNDLVPRDPWAQEVRDGVAVDLYRARFVRALYQAVLAEDPTPLLAEADQALALARVVIDRRHADLHDPLDSILMSDDVENPTIYQYGYLVRAQELCFWERERIGAASLLEGGTDPVPGCI